MLENFEDCGANIINIKVDSFNLEAVPASYAKILAIKYNATLRDLRELMKENLALRERLADAEKRLHILNL